MKGNTHKPELAFIGTVRVSLIESGSNYSKYTRIGYLSALRINALYIIAVLVNAWFVVF